MTPIKRAVTINGIQRWQLDFGLDAATGKRPRTLMDTEKEADDEIAKCKKLEKANGEYWMRLPQAKRDIIVATLQDMQNKNFEVQDVWSQFQAHRNAVDAQSTTTPVTRLGAPV